MGFPRKIFYSLFQLLLVSFALPQLCCAVNVEVKDPAQAPTKHDQINEQELVICEQETVEAIVTIIEKPSLRITPAKISSTEFIDYSTNQYPNAFSAYQLPIYAQPKADTKSPLYIAFQQLII